MHSNGKVWYKNGIGDIYKINTGVTYENRIHKSENMNLTNY